MSQSEHDEEKIEKKHSRRKLEIIQDPKKEFKEQLNSDSLLDHLERCQGRIQDILKQEDIREKISIVFRIFLTTFKVKSTDIMPIYMSKVIDLIKNSKTSLIINYMHLVEFGRIIHKWTLIQPKSMLELFDKVAYEVVCDKQPQFSQMWSKAVYVRFENLPTEEKIRSLNFTCLDALIYVKGIVTRRTSVFPQLRLVKYNCDKCGELLGPFYQNEETVNKPSACRTCGNKTMFSINMRETVYGNFQKLTLQESPGDVPSGMLPRSKEVILQNVI